MINYSAVRLDNLNKMREIAIDTPEQNFRMNLFWYPAFYGNCGSVGCLLGNYFKSDRICRDEQLTEFGLDSQSLNHLCYRYGPFEDEATEYSTQIKIAEWLDKEEAIHRLTTFIKYVQRKKILLADYEDLMKLSKKARRELQQSPRKVLV